MSDKIINQNVFLERVRNLIREGFKDERISDERRERIVGQIMDGLTPFLINSLPEQTKPKGGPQATVMTEQAARYGHPDRDEYSGHKPEAR